MKAKVKSKRVVKKGSKYMKQILSASAKGALAMKGNHWWAKRSKHGRDAIFKDANALLEAAMEYFEDVEENPDYKTEWKDKGLEEIPVKRPYLVQELCSFLHVNSHYWRDFKTNKIAATGDFPAVIKWIEDTMESQKLRGSINGFFNPNITARLLGLVDRTDVTSDNKALPTPSINIIQGPKFSSSEDEIKE